MADLVLAHRRAAGDFGRLVLSIGADEWHLPTPCVGWDVRDLVNHLVYDNCWAPLTAGGATVGEVGDRFEGDLLGPDPEQTWRSSIAAALAAFEDEGALDRTVHLSYGDAPARQYLVERITDLVIHGWDLARALGRDDNLDPELVELLWETWEPREAALRQSGLFADRVDVGADADLETRLLALLGRRR